MEFPSASDFDLSVYFYCAKLICFPDCRVSFNDQRPQGEIELIQCNLVELNLD